MPIINNTLQLLYEYYESPAFGISTGKIIPDPRILFPIYKPASKTYTNLILSAVKMGNYLTCPKL